MEIRRTYQFRPSKDSEGDPKNEAKKRLVKCFFCLKKKQKNIFEVRRTYQFRSSSTSKPRNLKKNKEKIVSKKELETRNEKTTQLTRSLGELPKPKEEKKKKIQVTKHLQPQTKNFQFSPKKKIPKLNRKYLQNKIPRSKFEYKRRKNKSPNSTYKEEKIKVRI